MKKQRKNTDESKKIILLTAALTLITVKFFVYLYSPNSWIWKDWFHHIYYAVPAMILYFFTKNKEIKSALFGFSAGLIIEEGPYLLTAIFIEGGKQLYLSLPIILSNIILIILLFLFIRKTKYRF